MPKITDYKPLQKNPNKGSQRGMGVLDESVRKLGAGRSLLVDKNGVIIAGNHAQEAFINAGIEDVIEVETTGNQVVVVKRTDMDADSIEGKKMAIMDNRSSELGLAWDEVILEETMQQVIAEEGELDIALEQLREDMGLDLQIIDREEQLDSIENADKSSNVDLIFTSGVLSHTAIDEPRNIMTVCCIAIRSGWLYGVQSNRGVCLSSLYQKKHLPQFIDNDYFHYDHHVHLESVKKWKPKYCTVMDVMTKHQCEQDNIQYNELEQILDWAEELSEHAENVIVIPKYDCLDKIPEKFMLGYSVPTSHGGTPLPIELFKGRRVHLLGGSPNKQIAFWQRIPDSVVSIDNNYILKIANYGNAWFPDGTTRSLTDIGFGELTNPLYTALVISLGNFAAYFNKQGDDSAQINQFSPAVEETR